MHEHGFIVTTSIVQLQRRRASPFEGGEELRLRGLLLNGCQLPRCDEFPALVGMPLEPHRIETVDGLPDEA
jgi:hypothetical protein